MIDYILTKFPDAQLHLAIAEDIKNDPLASYNRMFRFLGCRDLAPEELEVDFNVNRTRYRGTVQTQDFAWLHEIYQPLNERLYQLLGAEVDAGSVCIGPFDRAPSRVRQCKSYRRTRGAASSRPTRPIKWAA